MTSYQLYQELLDLNFHQTTLYVVSANLYKIHFYNEAKILLVYLIQLYLYLVPHGQLKPLKKKEIKYIINV